jgi:hypothetical protein
MVPHEMADDQKRSRCESSEELLNVLRNGESARFSHVPQPMNLGSHIVANTLTFDKILHGSAAKDEGSNYCKIRYGDLISTGMKLLVLDVLAGEKKFNQDHS